MGAQNWRKWATLSLHFRHSLHLATTFISTPFMVRLVIGSKWVTEKKEENFFLKALLYHFCCILLFLLIFSPCLKYLSHFWLIFVPFLSQFSLLHRLLFFSLKSETNRSLKKRGLFFKRFSHNSEVALKSWTGRNMILSDVHILHHQDFYRREITFLR